MWRNLIASVSEFSRARFSLRRKCLQHREAVMVGENARVPRINRNLLADDLFMEDLVACGAAPIRASGPTRWRRARITTAYRVTKS